MPHGYCRVCGSIESPNYDFEHHFSVEQARWVHHPDAGGVWDEGVCELCDVDLNDGPHRCVALEEVEPTPSAASDAGPIETAYNGYRFRSRHEARFAVLLDRLGLSYGYEVEGFKLGGLRYLPDFRMNDRQRPYWVEVKYELPRDLDERWEAYEKARRLASHAGLDVYVAYGEFTTLHDPRGLRAYKLSSTGYSGDGYVLVECSSCGSVGFSLRGLHGWTAPDGCWCKPTELELDPASPRLVHAYGEARSARFEFGETPSRSPAPPRSQADRRRPRAGPPRRRRPSAR